MKVLHILKAGPEGAIEQIIEAHKRSHQVQVIRLDGEGVDYGEIIQAIEQADRVMAW